jgi:hypothetical protein
MDAQRGEEVYSSYSFLSSALDGGKWSACFVVLVAAVVVVVQSVPQREHHNSPL